MLLNDAIERWSHEAESDELTCYHWGYEEMDEKGIREPLQKEVSEKFWTYVSQIDCGPHLTIEESDNDDALCYLSLPDGSISYDSFQSLLEDKVELGTLNTEEDIEVFSKDLISKIEEVWTVVCQSYEQSVKEVEEIHQVRINGGLYAVKKEDISNENNKS